MSLPKILYFSDVDMTIPGGAQESMKIIINELTPDFDFYLITPRGKKVFTNQIILENHTNFILRGKSFKELYKLVKDFSFKIKQIDPDMIHVQTPASLIIINFLLMIKKIDKHVKIIYTDRGVYGKYGKITTSSINSIVKKADRIITTTNVNKNNYMSKFRDFQEKFSVIYNTGGKTFDKYENKKNEIKKQLGIKNFNKKTFGFCGRYTPQKNWALASEIINLCNKKFDNVNFVLVIGTDGTLTNRKEVDNFLKPLIDKLGNNKLKYFIDIDNEKMSDLYYAFDFFVLTSKYESFGRTAVEAMSRKNVVLGTNVDGLSEVIGNENYLFNTSNELVEIIQKIIMDEKKLKKTSEYFFNRYHEKFGYIQNVKKYKALYDKLLL